MNSLLPMLASYAMNATWEIAVLAAAAWILARLLQRTGPDVPHRIWVATLISATLVPMTPMLRSYFRFEAPPVEAIAFRAAVEASGTGEAPIHSGVALSPFIISSIAGFYALAVIFFLARLGWMIHCTAALVRRANPAPLDAESASLWRLAKESVGVGDAALLSSPDVSGPVTTGFIRPMLLLPATFIGTHSRTEILAAAGHECVHIKRNDFSKNLFYEVIGLFTAFHPVSWFIKSQIAQTREMICDETAADSLLCRQSYALSLLQLASKVPHAVPAVVSHAMGIFDTNTLERRIMTLNSAKPNVSKAKRSLTAAGAVLLLFVCGAATALMTRSVAAQTPSQKKAATPDLSCTYYKDGNGSPGTCGFDREDRKKYRCFSNENPEQSNPQIACEWKVQRALAAQKK